MFFTWDAVVDWSLRPTALTVLVSLVVAAAILGTLEWLHRARPPRPRTDRLTDLLFWFFTPLVSKALTYALLAAALGGLLAVDPELTGHGPVARQPGWLQFLQVLALGDLIHYWSHRLLHRPALWPVHAVHHSPTELDWLSAMRLHPLDDLAGRLCQVLPLLAAGYSPAAVAAYLPAVLIWVVVTHTDLPWTFGPLRYVFVSPAFHRWHHSSQPEAVDTNFAGILSMWDVLFGTYYLPAGRRAERFGVVGAAPPVGFAGLLLHPFRQWLRWLPWRWMGTVVLPKQLRRAGRTPLPRR